MVWEIRTKNHLSFSILRWSAKKAFWLVKKSEMSLLASNRAINEFKDYTTPRRKVFQHNMFECKKEDLLNVEKVLADPPEVNVLFLLT